MRAPALFALFACAALAAAQNYFVNCGSATDATRFVTRPGDTESRVSGRVSIRGATSQYLYQNHRLARPGVNQFTYVFPKRFPGTYLIEFAWAEISSRPEVCATGARRFNAYIQRQRVLTNFDVYQKAGCQRATRERFTTTVGSDGLLTFTFQRGSSGDPFISYIKAVYQQSTPTPTPLPCRGLGNMQRKAVNDMTNGEWNNYVRAFNLMRQRNIGNLNVYEWFSETHRTDALHNQLSFLPWHRAMLFYWDIELHEGVPGVRQPYFDWSRSAENVFGNRAFSNDRYGGSSNGGSFRGLTSRVPNAHTVTRGFNNEELRTPQFLNALIRSGNSFNNFRLSLEAAHNAFHVAVGGDMVTASSPNDPLFYAHHAFIDKIWQDWISISGQRGVPTSIGSTRMRPWNEDANAVMGAAFSGCVSYEIQRAASAINGDDPLNEELEIAATANAAQAHKEFGASEEDLALLAEIDAAIMASIGVDATATAPPTTTVANITTTTEEEISTKVVTTTVEETAPEESTTRAIMTTEDAESEATVIAAAETADASLAAAAVAVTTAAASTETRAVEDTTTTLVEDTTTTAVVDATTTTVELTTTTETTTNATSSTPPAEE